MGYSIQEIVANTVTNNTDTMVPILIGQSKTIYQESLNFIDVNKTQLQLSNINNSIIDETTLLVNIKSWNIKNTQFNITNSIAGINQINVNLISTQQFPNTSIFIIVDANNNILFSSNIDTFIYNLSGLATIILTDPLTLTGSLNCYLINLETQNISGSFDALSNILTIDTNFIFKTPSINYIYENSYISYVGASRTYSIDYLSIISQTDIDSQKNININKGLNLNQSAVVISYPSDIYLSQLLDDLDKLNTGYYIVPINLSNQAIQNLILYVKSRESQSIYRQLIVSTDIILSNTIISNALYTA